MKTSILHLMKKCYADTSSQDTSYASLQGLDDASVQDTVIKATTTATTTTTTSANTHAVPWTVPPATFEPITSITTTSITTTSIATTTTDPNPPTEPEPEDAIDAKERPVKSTPYSSQISQSNQARSPVKLEELILAEELQLLEQDEYLGTLTYPILTLPSRKQNKHVLVLY